MALRNGADEEEGECDAEQHQSVLHFSARFACQKGGARASGWDAMRRERIKGDIATESRRGDARGTQAQTTSRRSAGPLLLRRVALRHTLAPRPRSPLGVLLLRLGQY